MIVHTPAVVLRTIPYGDSSLISTCFTFEKGKVGLIIKGARSKKSPKVAQFQPLSFIEIIYYDKPNRDLQVLSKVSFKESWPHIQDSLKSVSFCLAIMEMTDRTLGENDPHSGLFNILVDVLRSFNDGEFDPNILFWFYECALLSHLGFRPDLDCREMPGISFPDPYEGEHSGEILLQLMNERIDQLPINHISPTDNRVISNYLQQQLFYHFDDLVRLRSLDIARQILAD